MKWLMSLSPDGLAFAFTGSLITLALFVRLADFAGAAFFFAAPAFFFAFAMIAVLPF
jgi:hypothetical protein